MIDDTNPIMPKDAPSIRREQFAGIHQRQQIPVRILDQMADILFDKRDEVHEFDSEFGQAGPRKAMQMRSKTQRIVHGDPRSKEAREIVGRAEEFYAAAETPDPVRYDATLDLYDMQRGAKDDPDMLRRTKAALGIELTATEKWRQRVQRDRRKKKRARYNRGKSGVRPRNRAGR